MLFWIITGLLSVGLCFALAGAMRRGPTAGPAPAAYDLAVYKDQLSEIDRDLARDVLTAEEADRLRTEVSRRILNADRALTEQEAEAPAGKGSLPAFLLAAPILVAAFGIYAWLGAPGYDDMPIETRKENARVLADTRPLQTEAEAQAVPFQPTADPRLADLVTKLRAALQSRPDDLQGHQLLARNEASLGNYTAAHTAQSNVIRIKDAASTAEDHFTYAELMIFAANGYISPEAETALLATLRLAPDTAPALFYIGELYAQTGRPDRAFALWNQVLKTSAPSDPWVGPIRADIETLADLAGVARFELPPLAAANNGAPAGPSAEDIAAAQDMAPEDRTAMIQGMVAGLSDRLATNGGPASEWAQLIRALGVLGDQSQAQLIYREALGLFAADPRALSQIRAAAQASELIP